jgi:hypothetical protein
VYRDAKLIASISGLTYVLADKRAAEYQISSVDSEGRESFLSEPVTANSEPIVVRATASRGQSNAGVQARASLVAEGGVATSGAIQLDRDPPSGLSLRATIPVAGRYEIKFRYANGSGPINTDNKCAIRTLFVDGKRVGAIVMPQRGVMQWSTWGFSSVQSLDMKKGSHVIELRFEPEDENMSPDVNRVVVDSVYLQAHH